MCVYRYIYIWKYVFIFIYMCMCTEKRLKAYLKLMSTYFAETVWIRRWGELKGSLIFYSIYDCITSFFSFAHKNIFIYNITDVKINKQISLKCMLIPRKKVNPSGQICLFVCVFSFFYYYYKGTFWFSLKPGQSWVPQVGESPSLAIFISSDVFLFRC